MFVIVGKAEGGGFFVRTNSGLTTKTALELEEEAKDHEDSAMRHAVAARRIRDELAKAMEQD